MPALFLVFGLILAGLVRNISDTFPECFMCKLLVKIWLLSLAYHEKVEEDVDPSLAV